jgi:hypothetical protein
MLKLLFVNWVLGGGNSALPKSEEEIKAYEDLIKQLEKHPCKNWKAKTLRQYKEHIQKIKNRHKEK